MRQRFGIGLACAVMLAAFAAPAAAATKCNVKSMQKAAPADTTIVTAAMMDKPKPHCRVEGYVTTTNPGPNKVNFRLQLPDKKAWTGRYYFIGMGGSAGYVPSDSQLPGGNPLIKGFAVAGTDTGHKGHILDWSFMGDPAKGLDHIHRGAHVTAIATQQLTKAYYKTDKIYRYHSGCSGGGRMGWEALANHPEDFDGILIGESGSRVVPPRSGTILKFIQASQQYNREPGAYVSPTKIKMVDAKATEACDMTDGAKDGVVWDHRLCKFDVATLKCKTGDKDDCLTAKEIKTLKAILAGPHDPKGNLLSQPMPITNLSTAIGFLGNAPPPWSAEASVENMPKSSSGYVIATTMGHGMIGPDYDILKDFSFKKQEDIDRFEKGFGSTGFGSNFPQNLEPFDAHGGKLLMWGGVSSPCCSNIDQEDYVDTMKQKMGAERASKFIQFYNIPGMGHCGGGVGPQDAPDRLLQTLVDWVEKGQQPGPVVTHRGAARVQLIFTDPNAEQESGVRIPNPVGGARDFLVCPYPQISVFDKSKASDPNAVNEAANWSCQAPTGGRRS